MNSETNNELEKVLFLGYVAQVLESHPDWLRLTIDAATQGVCKFADNQKDIGAKLAFKLVSVLDTVPVQARYGAFDLNSILADLAPWFDGTQWMKSKQGVVKQAATDDREYPLNETKEEQ